MAEEAFSKSSFVFSVKLFKELSKEFKNNDYYIYSPLSIQSCLTMLYMGAEGTSADSIAKVLHYNQTLNKVDVACLIKLLMEQGEQDDSVEVANAILLLDPQAKISNFYQKIIKTYFHSSIEPIIMDDDKKVVTAINERMSNSTHGRIKSILEETDLDDGKKLILLDAIYFKGRWSYGFDKTLTKPRKFFYKKDEFVQVPTMEITNHFNYCRFEDFKFSVLELNYVESELSLLIFMPDEPSQLALIETNAEQLNILDIVTMLYLKTVQVFLPKFSFEFKCDLKQAFMGMGMGDLFTPEANLRGIFEKQENICVDSVIHKAVIVVDEDGAAVHDKDLGEVEVVFDVNKPFYFCLKHRYEHNVVFSGCVKKF